MRKKHRGLWNDFLSRFGLTPARKQKQAQSVKPRALRLEPLEVRQLLSVTTLYWDPNGATNLGGSGTWQPENNKSPVCIILGWSRNVKGV